MSWQILRRITTQQFVHWKPYPVGAQFPWRRPKSPSVGDRIRLPTIGETLRVKTFLVVDRNATRDYLDVAALFHSLGIKKSAVALERMNEIYSEFAGEGGDMLTSALVKLAAPDPYDLTDIDLAEYKGIIAPWNNLRKEDSNP